MFKLCGKWLFIVNGLLQAFGKNVVTNTLGARVISALVSGQLTPFTYIAIGSGSTLELPTQTSLFTEVYRILATPSVTSTSFSNDTFKLSGSFSAAQNFTVYEIGIFDAVTAGNMGARGTFRDISGNPIAKSVTIGQIVTLEYLIQIVPST